MGSSLNNMSKTERHALEWFGDAVKSRLGEYVEEEGLSLS